MGSEDYLDIQDLIKLEKIIIPKHLHLSKLKIREINPLIQNSYKTIMKLKNHWYDLFEKDNDICDAIHEMDKKIYKYSGKLDKAKKKDIN